LKSETSSDGTRFYTLEDGAKFPSITTVLGAMKKDAIMAWRKRVGAATANAISKKATGRGTTVHSLCEQYLNNEAIDHKNTMPDALDMFYSLKPFLANINNIWYQEQALYSRKLELAGRVDCIAEYEGELSIIDFKTSARIKTKDQIEDYFAQCCAYSLMLEEMIGTPVDNLVIIMAVENSVPLVFKERTENYIETLVKYINFYKNQSL
jgi:genome maintenance exonuclease 1